MIFGDIKRYWGILDDIYVYWTILGLYSGILDDIGGY